MKGQSLNQRMLKIRRLSTSSSMAEKFTALATDWVWYWESENGWIEYGRQVGD